MTGNIATLRRTLVTEIISTIRGGVRYLSGAGRHRDPQALPTLRTRTWQRRALRENIRATIREIRAWQRRKTQCFGDNERDCPVTDAQPDLFETFDAGSWRRFREELATAPTRAAATDVFYSHDFLFLGLSCDERERRYAEVEDVIREKPDENSHTVVRLAHRPLTAGKRKEVKL